MSTLAATEIGAPESGQADVPLAKIDAELNRRLKAAQGDADAPVQRVRMSNLIIYCDDAEKMCSAESLVPEIVANHPARVLLLLADPAGSNGGDVKASVLVRQVDDDPRLVSEQVTLRAVGGAIDKLPFVVRSLLIGDLPTNLWWASSTPPPLAGADPRRAGRAGRAGRLRQPGLGRPQPRRSPATRPGSASSSATRARAAGGSPPT